MALNILFVPRILAQEASPTLREKKTEEGYILNLKELIKESKSKIERVDDKLKEQAKMRRNQQREETAREYFEKAKRLYDEGKFEDAQEFWKKAIKITEHPEMKDYIHESVKKTSRQSALLQSEEDRRLKRLELDRGYSAAEVEKVYQSAVSLYKQKKFLESKNDFDKVEDMFPDHKATRSYLMLIEHEIDQSQQVLIDKKVKEEAMSLQKEKDVWKEDLIKKESEQVQQVNQQAQAQYLEAVELYNAKDFDQAREKFQAVEWIVPNYKDTGKYLTKLEVERKSKERQQEDQTAKEERLKLEKEMQAQKEFAVTEAARKKQEEAEKNKRFEEEAEFSYNAAISLYTKKLFLQAKEKLLDVEKVYPNYKSTKQYLARIDKDMSDETLRLEMERQKVMAQKKKEEDLVIARQEEEKRKQRALDEKKRQEKLVEEAEGVYSQAVAFYKNRQFKDAKIKFEQLQKVYLGYKSVVQYMSRIDLDIAEEEKRQVLEKQKAIEERQRLENLTQEQRSQEEKLTEKRVEEEKTRQEKEAKEQALKEEKNRLAKAKEDERLARLKEQEEKNNEQAMLDRVNDFYQQAVKLHKEKSFEKAKEIFEDINQLKPNYKSTAVYLQKIDGDILAQQQEESKPVVSQQPESVKEEKFSLNTKAIAKEEERRRKEAEKIQEQKANQERIAREREDARLAKIKEDEDRQRQESLQRQAEAIYQDALKLYKAKEFNKAKKRFNDCLAVLPEYKKSQNYLARLDEEKASFERKQLEEQDSLAMQIKSQKQKESSQTVIEQAPNIIVKEALSDKEVIQKQREEELRIAHQAKMDRDRKSKEEKAKVKKEQEEIAAIYQEAVALFDDKSYDQAKFKFEEFLESNPSDRKAKKYLSKIDQILSAPIKESIVQTKSKEPLDEMAVESKPSKHVVLSDDALVAKAQEDRRKRIAQEAEIKYSQAMSFYKSKDYLKAKSTFIEVEKISPGYKSAVSYVGEIDDLLAKNQTQLGLSNDSEKSLQKTVSSKIRSYEEDLSSEDNKQIYSQEEIDNPQVETLYQSALKLISNKQYVVAREKLNELNQQFPSYKDTQILLAKTSGIVAQEVKMMSAPAIKVEADEPEPVEIENSVCDETQEDYQQAMDHYKAGRLVEAKTILLQINHRTPCRSEVKKYLSIINRKLRAQDKAALKQIAINQSIPADKNTYSTINNSEAANYEWMDNSNKQDVLLKLRREQLKKLEGERYQKLKERIDHEEMVKKQVLRDRKIEDALRRRTLHKRFTEEEQNKKIEALRLSQEEKQRQLEEEAQQKQEEIAKKKEDDRIKAQELVQKQEEERRLRLEAIEKQKEEARLAKEARLKQIEEEKRQKQEEIAKKKEEEQNQKEEMLRQNEEEVLKQKEELARKSEEVRQAAEEKMAVQQTLEEENKMQDQKNRLVSFGDDASPEDVDLTQYEYGKYKDQLKRKDSKEYLDRIRNKKEQLKNKIKKDLRYQSVKINNSLKKAYKSDQTLHLDHVEQIYQEAVALYREGRFVAAKAKFSMADGLISGYKSAPSYVRACDANIEGEKRRVTQAQEKEAIAQEKARIQKEREEKLKQEQEEKEQARIMAIEEEKKIKEEQKQAQLDRREALKKEQEENEAARLKVLEEKESARLKALAEKEEARLKAQEEKEAVRLKALEEKEVARLKVIEEEKKVKEETKNKKIQERLVQKKAQQETEEQLQQKKAIEQQQMLKEKERTKIQEEQQAEIVQKREEVKEMSDKAREDRLKREEEQQRLKEKAMKEEEALNRKKEKEEELARVKKDKDAQKEINQAYQEFKILIKKKEFDEASAKTVAIESMLGQAILSKEFVDKINMQLAEDKNRIKDARDLVAQKEYQETQKREEELARVKREREEKDRMALTQIQEKIQVQEESLSKERKVLEDRLAREKARVEDQLAQERRLDEERLRKEQLRLEKLAALENDEQIKSVAPKKNLDVANNIELLKTERKVQEEQNRLAKQKEEELKKQRELVKKEFDDRLLALYKRAAGLYKQGVLDEAYTILSEIDRMSPSYQDTKDLLKQIERKKISSMSNAVILQNKVIDSKKKPVKSRQDLIQSALDSVEEKI